MKSLPYFLVLVLFAFHLQGEAQINLSAEQVAQKAAAKISGSNGLSAQFTIVNNGKKGNGSIKSSGNKFTVNLPGASMWYNGKDLYTFNSNTNETTIVNPTAQELLDSNPLLYVKSGGGAFSYSFSPNKIKGKYVVNLLPRDKKNEIKKLIFTVNANDFKTEKIEVNTSNGNFTIEITDFKTNIPISSNEFEYPKSKYPNAEIVDLR